MWRLLRPSGCCWPPSCGQTAGHAPHGTHGGAHELRNAQAISVSPMMLAWELRGHAHAFLFLVVVGGLTGEACARQLLRASCHRWDPTAAATSWSLGTATVRPAQQLQRASTRPRLADTASAMCRLSSLGMQQTPLAPVTSCAGQCELSRAMHSVLGGVLTASSRENTGRMNFSSKSAHHSASWMVCGLLPPSLHSHQLGSPFAV